LVVPLFYIGKRVCVLPVKFLFSLSGTCESLLPPEHYRAAPPMDVEPPSPFLFSSEQAWVTLMKDHHHPQVTTFPLFFPLFRSGELRVFLAYLPFLDNLFVLLFLHSLPRSSVVFPFCQPHLRSYCFRFVMPRPWARQGLRGAPLPCASLLSLVSGKGVFQVSPPCSPSTRYTRVIF